MNPSGIDRKGRHIGVIEPARGVSATVLTSLLIALASCLSYNDPTNVQEICKPRPSMRGTEVPACLWAQGKIDPATYRAADSLLASAVRLGDSELGDTGANVYYKYVELVRAVGHVADFYNEGLFPDSVRFNRLVDHVAVTAEYARGTIRKYNNVYYPARTPQLGWTYYQSYGFYFQPVNTVQQLSYLLGAPTASLDTLSKLGQAVWAYAVWHRGGGRDFPIWEYEFPWYASGAVWLFPPWQSAMAQGTVMELYTELYRRTQEPIWRNRARAVFECFRVSMDDGGVLLPDTTHGYWWEEYHPRVMVWNGSVKALLTLGDYAQTFHDTTALRMYASGVGAVKFYTPRYDTGTWTYYSLTGYFNTRYYHGFQVQELNALLVQNGYPGFQ